VADIRKLSKGWADEALVLLSLVEGDLKQATRLIARGRRSDFAASSFMLESAACTVSQVRIYQQVLKDVDFDPEFIEDLEDRLSDIEEATKFANEAILMQTGVVAQGFAKPAE
jgi:hypothetical protein